MQKKPGRAAPPTFLINHASRLLVRRFDERLRPLAFSMAYLRVAVVLEEHGALQQADLLEYVDIEQPTMAALITRMERDSLLVREPDPTDARARLISLTSRGAAVLETARAAMLEVADEAMVGVSPRDREILARTLQTVARNLGEARPPFRG